jgi:sialate O-acetylesterase
MINVLSRVLEGLVRKLIIVWALALAWTGQAQVKLPNVFSDHGILQRDMPVRVWGSAAPGESVVVKIHGQEARSKASADGKWTVWLKPEAAGGPYALEVDGTNRIVLKDVLYGDVYLASGQSNMGYSFAGIQNSKMPHADQVLAAAADKNLRLLKVPKDFASTPRDNQPAKWAQSSSESAAEFSLLGYLFGRAISDREHVPVGIIHASYGGTPAEAWMSPEGLAAAMDLQAAEAVWKSQMTKDPNAKAGAENGIVFASGVRLNPPQWGASAEYNAMIAPLTGYTIKGVVWYQGESSSDPTRAKIYGATFAALIEDWRKIWGEGDFPFLWFQISSYGKSSPKADWGDVRDGQRRDLSLPNTAMAVTYDIGCVDNPHPPLKQQTADRMVLAARSLVYGEKVEWSGPLFAKAVQDGHGMRVSFAHTEGLKSYPGDLKGFEVAGADGKFVPATALIQGDGVVVSAPAVADPVTVRYAWANMSDANLYNKFNLPAATFTSAP